MTTNIKDTVTKVIIEILKVDESKVVPEATLVEDLGADSLDQVELIMAIEAAFNCNIPDEDANNIRTVKDIIDYLEKL